MRLRPSGSQGPIAVSLEAFRKYHAQSSQTWEHMAWTRARIVAASDTAASNIRAVINAFLVRPRDTGALAMDVAQMRVRIDREFHSDNIWDFKHIRGGLVDAEFITQFLLLRDASVTPGVLHGTTIRALSLLGEHQSVPKATVTALAASLGLMCDLQQVTRLCLGDRLDVPVAPAALRNMMAARVQAGTFAFLELRLIEAEKNVFNLYRQIILGAAGLDEEPSFQP